MRLFGLRTALCGWTLGQATRHLDVDTKWLQETGVLAAKDRISVEDYPHIENQSEEKLHKVREPALKVAQKLLP